MLPARRQLRLQYGHLGCGVPPTLGAAGAVNGLARVNDRHAGGTSSATGGLALGVGHGRVTDRLAGRFHSARDVTKPRAHRSLAGEAKASVPPRHSRIIRGELANWTRVRVTTLYSVDPRDPDHDAAMRIDGEAPGRQSHSQKRHRSQGSRRVTAASDRHRRFVMRGRPAPKPFAFAISLSSVMTPYAG